MRQPRPRNPLDHGAENTRLPEANARLLEANALLNDPTGARAGESSSAVSSTAARTSIPARVAIRSRALRWTSWFGTLLAAILVSAGVVLVGIGARTVGASVGESLGATGAAVGLVISLVVWKSSIRIARAQYHQAMQQTWNEFNSEVLGSEENLEIAEWLFSSEELPRPHFNLERCRFLTFMALNAIHSAFLGERAGVVDRGYADSNLEDLLSRMLLKDFLFDLTQGRGYHPAFREYCRAARNQLLSELDNRSDVEREGRPGRSKRESEDHHTQ
jgi:hypothetical protein